MHTSCVPPPLAAIVSDGATAAARGHGINRNEEAKAQFDRSMGVIPRLTLTRSQPEPINTGGGLAGGNHRADALFWASL